ncbi:MAG: NAD(P)H-dependent oxidoreductase subunit E [Chloroflexi bacterium]|nr:NAD(P)H-dependent oxidoreductase subunit E [Chloroflexota bacterium]
MPEGLEDIADKIRAYPRQRTYLLPVLMAVQDEIGWLPDWAIEYAGAHLRVPKSEAYGAASSFPELRLHEPPDPLLRVCIGAACQLQGASALQSAAASSGAELEEVDCLFICALAPAAELNGRMIGRATAEKLRA